MKRSADRSVSQDWLSLGLLSLVTGSALSAETARIDDAAFELEAVVVTATRAGFIPLALFVTGFMRWRHKLQAQRVLQQRWLKGR